MTMKSNNLVPIAMLWGTWSGMSLRDWFAGKATDTDVERWMDIMYANNTPVTREEAKYLYADAMLKARQQ